jgi:hypothetical protein
MKIHYSIFVIVPFLFIDCSSTYSIKNFSSKENFYNAFNKSVDSNSVKVTLITDSTFITDNVKILNDSIFYSQPGYELKNQKIISDSSRDFTTFGNRIPLNKIKKLSYNNRWRGFEYGAITFIVPGTFAGILSTAGKDYTGLTTTTYIVSLASGIAGGIFGAIFGWNYIYQINR